MKKEVAPRAGAWIETNYGDFQYWCEESPLAQGRGLKHGQVGDQVYDQGRPSRRGVD